MTLARRIALFIDPTLVPEPALLEEAEPIRLDFNAHHYAEMASQLTKIARSLDRIERKTVARRPRYIDCTHPELHPEVEAA